MTNAQWQSVIASKVDYAAKMMFAAMEAGDQDEAAKYASHLAAIDRRSYDEIAMEVYMRENEKQAMIAAA